MYITKALSSKNNMIHQKRLALTLGVTYDVAGVAVYLSNPVM